VCSTVVEGKWEKFGAKASCVEHERLVETDQSVGERLPDECFAEGLGGQGRTTSTQYSVFGLSVENECEYSVQQWILFSLEEGFVSPCEQAVHYQGGCCLIIEGNGRRTSIYRQWFSNFRCSVH